MHGMMLEAVCTRNLRFAASQQRPRRLRRPFAVPLQAAGNTAVAAKTKKRAKNREQTASKPKTSPGGSVSDLLAPAGDDALLHGEKHAQAQAADRTSSSRVGKFGTNTCRALVLDLAYRPINVVSWLKALKMDMLGKAEVLEYYDSCCVVSAYRTFPMPAVLRVKVLLDMSALHARVSLTRRNILLRDKCTCQYCGTKGLLPKNLTIDHVVPVSLGGKNTWDNLVTACKTCNQRKGSSQLKQLGWRLRAPLREPTMYELGMIARGVHPSEVDNPPMEWRGYIQLKKDKRAASEL